MRDSRLYPDPPSRLKPPARPGPDPAGEMGSFRRDRVGSFRARGMGSSRRGSRWGGHSCPPGGGKGRAGMPAPPDFSPSLPGSASILGELGSFRRRANWVRSVAARMGSFRGPTGLARLGSFRRGVGPRRPTRAGVGDLPGEGGGKRGWVWLTGSARVPGRVGGGVREPPRRYYLCSGPRLTGRGAEFRGTEGAQRGRSPIAHFPPIPAGRNRGFRLASRPSGGGHRLKAGGRGCRP